MGFLDLEDDRSLVFINVVVGAMLDGVCATDCPHRAAYARDPTLRACTSRRNREDRLHASAESQILRRRDGYLPARMMKPG